MACTPGVDSEAVGRADRGLVRVSPLAPLSTEPVPQLVGSDIIDPEAAARLGKAFFWDVQVGGDGQTACATCHFHAGVDHRVTNTIHPGVDGRFELVGGPGETWNGVTDPLHVDDVVGSQGVVRGSFIAIGVASPDTCAPEDDVFFGSHRQVTGRSAPTFFGAIFNFESFWDGRADHIFNGEDSLGEAGSGTRWMENGSLASQAVGPANNEVEMACLGRLFDDLGAKILDRVPLTHQVIHRTDSLLGPIASWPRTGTRCGGTPCTYRGLVAEAFGSEIAANAEAQFASIWGQAIQAYASKTIPDQAPIDAFLSGDASALTSSQELGLRIFRGELHPATGALCMNCHHGPMLTDATVRFRQEAGPIHFDGGDTGFHNLGVDPTSADIGRGAFSESGSPMDDGAFKTPTLRNVGLTAPYFHDGSATTLGEVIDFYDRGGNFQNPQKASVIPPVANRPGQLGFTAEQRAALADFLGNALTDCRVEAEMAPFDHPSLVVPNGPSLPAVGAQGNGCLRCTPAGRVELGRACRSPRMGGRRR